MPVYSVSTQKAFNDGSHPGEVWTNTYHVNASDAVDALDKVGEIANEEKAIYWDNVSIVRLAVAGSGGGTGLFEDVTLVGERADGVLTTQLPLFNTVGVSYSYIGARRTVAHYRLPLDEADVESGNVVTDVRTLVYGAMITALFGLGFVCNPGGANLQGGFVKVPVVSRQDTSHRRVRPGFKRGWVAV